MPIKPNTMRTHEQLVEQGRKGGLKAQENRRKKIEYCTVKRSDITAIYQELEFIIDSLIELTEDNIQGARKKRIHEHLRGDLRGIKKTIEKDLYKYGGITEFINRDVNRD